MYVGITRAEEELYLSRALCRMLYGQTNHNPPSQFLAEIPSTCFTVKDATGRHAVPDPTPAPGYRPKNVKADQAAAKAGVEAALASGLIKRGSHLRPGTQAGDDCAIAGDPIAAGDRIIHQTFGRGTVLALRGPAETRAAVIAFDKHGSKELQLAFAMPKISKAP